jgi:hypothetical protein
LSDHSTLQPQQFDLVQKFELSNFTMRLEIVSFQNFQWLSHLFEDDICLAYAALTDWLQKLPDSLYQYVFDGNSMIFATCPAYTTQEKKKKQKRILYNRLFAWMRAEMQIALSYRT